MKQLRDMDSSHQCLVILVLDGVIRALRRKAEGPRKVNAMLWVGSVGLDYEPGRFI